jgi:hypothetical protein
LVQPGQQHRSPPNLYAPWTRSRPACGPSVNIPTTTPNGSLARVRTPKPLRDFLALCGARSFMLLVFVPTS